MTSKLSLGLVILPFVPSSILQGQEQEVCNERPNIIFIIEVEQRELFYRVAHLHPSFLLQFGSAP